MNPTYATRCVSKGVTHNQAVEFKDEKGNTHFGIALAVHSDWVAVGYCNNYRKLATTRFYDSLVGVPFANIVGTLERSVFSSPATVLRLTGYRDS